MNPYLRLAQARLARRERPGVLTGDECVARASADDVERPDNSPGATLTRVATVELGEDADVPDSAPMNKLDRLTWELRRLGIMFHPPIGSRD
ncbi:MAG TPA: hypothetical protein VFZ21_22470 [Gemmatimonadaceae bacterium]|nr:hypothetical protein [Gemmatimonadaceae bacterium]